MDTGLPEKVTYDVDEVCHEDHLRIARQDVASLILVVEVLIVEKVETAQHQDGKNKEGDIPIDRGRNTGDSFCTDLFDGLYELMIHDSNLFLDVRLL